MNSNHSEKFFYKSITKPIDIIGIVNYNTDIKLKPIGIVWIIKTEAENRKRRGEPAERG